MRTRTGAVALVVALIAGLGGAASAEASHHFKKLLELDCLVVTQENDPLIRARVEFRMGTRAHPNNNLRALAISARLIPANAARLSTFRWRSNQRTDVRSDGYNRKRVGVSTHDQSRAARNWNVQVKLRWRRRGKPDWTYKKTYRFDEATCLDAHRLAP